MAYCCCAHVLPTINQTGYEPRLSHGARNMLYRYYVSYQKHSAGEYTPRVSPTYVVCVTRHKAVHTIIVKRSQDQAGEHAQPLTFRPQCKASALNVRVSMSPYCCVSAGGETTNIQITSDIRLVQHYSKQTLLWYTSSLPYTTGNRREVIEHSPPDWFSKPIDVLRKTKRGTRTMELVRLWQYVVEMFSFIDRSAARRLHHFIPVVQKNILRARNPFLSLQSSSTPLSDGVFIKFDVCLCFTKRCCFVNHRFSDV